MRLTVLPLLAAALALSGCVVAVPPGAQVTTPPVVVTPPVTVTPARPDTVAARQVVNAEMAKRLPGRNVAPLTDCVISSATMAEVADLAAMQGTTGAADAVASIVKRPAVSQCIARAAVA